MKKNYLFLVLSLTIIQTLCIYKNHSSAHGNHYHGHYHHGHHHYPKKCISSPKSPLSPNNPKHPKSPKSPNSPNSPNNPQRPNNPNDPQKPNNPMTPHGPCRPSGPRGHLSKPYAPSGPQFPMRPMYPSLPCQGEQGPYYDINHYYPFYPQPPNYSYRRPPVHPMIKKLPFPIRPSESDIIRGLFPGMTYIMVLENSSMTLEVRKSEKKVYLRKYKNNNGEEWSLEKFTYEKNEYFRIKNTFTGEYLAIHPCTGAVVGYRITMVSEYEAKRSEKAAWKIVRNRNGSFSMINVVQNLSLSYSEKSSNKVTLKTFAHLPSQHFYFYDCKKCRKKLIGMMK